MILHARKRKCKLEFDDTYLETRIVRVWTIQRDTASASRQNIYTVDVATSSLFVILALRSPLLCGLAKLPLWQFV